MAVILPPRRFLLSATSTEKSLATMALSQPACGCGWGEGGPRREHCQSHLNKKTSQNLRHDNMLLLEQETAV